MSEEMKGLKLVVLIVVALFMPCGSPGELTHKMQSPEFNDAYMRKFIHEVNTAPSGGDYQSMLDEMSESPVEAIIGLVGYAEHVAKVGTTHKEDKFIKYPTTLAIYKLNLKNPGLSDLLAKSKNAVISKAAKDSKEWGKQ